MKVLVIGQGGREHALVKALSTSRSVREVHCAPGSDGMRTEAVLHPIDVKDASAVSRLCQQQNFDLVVIGPEAPLAAGLSDALRKEGLKVFGPSQAAAQLESSKIFSKKFLREADVPTARFEEVQSVEETMAASKQFSAPYVLKADGLAQGKGVFICQTEGELREAAEKLFVHKVLGPEGQRALLEEFHRGAEISILILTNGENYTTLPLAQDYKRLKEKDQGPNTGGMGSWAPVKIDKNLHIEIAEKILDPTVRQLKKLGLLYRGVLYCGVMVTESGPLVLEFNVRFGDPEAQVLLPLLDGDWGQAMLTIANGEVPNLQWKSLHATCVVLAAEGYPDRPVKDAVIQGQILSSTASSYFLHAGTRLSAQGDWVTQGGRVLNSIGVGSSRVEATKNAYRQAALVNWKGMQKRGDVG